MVGPLQGSSPIQSSDQLIRARSGLVGMNGTIPGSVKGVSQILPIDPEPMTSVISAEPGIEALMEPKTGGTPSGLGKFFDRTA